MNTAFKWIFYPLALAWLSTVVFNAIYDIYAEGGWWKVAAYIIMFLAFSVYGATMWGAARIINRREEKDKGDDHN